MGMEKGIKNLKSKFALDDREIAVARAVWCERQPEIDALKEERDHVYNLLRGRTPAQCDLLSLEIASLKAELREERQLHADANKNMCRLLAENERLTTRVPYREAFQRGAASCDNLRKAAKEFLAYMDTTEPVFPEQFESVIANLRAALGGM